MNGFRTIIMAGVAFVGELLRQFDIEIDAEGITNSVMILGGTIGAIYFRLKATKVFGQ
jgi:hypothetical protein